MTSEEFLAIVENEDPPGFLPEILLALWFDRKGDWDKAHELAQAIPTSDGSWVHAYLHRREGDLWNARYWYNRAGRAESKADLESEWLEIVDTLVDR